MIRDTFSIFRSVTSYKTETLGEVTRFLSLASNREIREKGFRIVSDVDTFLSSGGIADVCRHASMLFASQRKTIPLVKDPYYVLSNKNLVFTPNGDTAFVFLIKEED